MTLEEAIKHCEEKAEEQEYVSRIIVELHREGSEREHKAACDACAAEHRQLAEWLTELKDLREENKVLISECDRLIKEKGELLKKSEQIAEYKRLLKIAVEDFKEINSDILTCKYCKWNSEDTDDCAYYHGDVPCEKICGWKHEGEALALIGEDGDTE